MNGVPLWMVSSFRKRIDALDQRIQTNPKYQSEWKTESGFFDRFKDSLSAEQLKMFLEWEERMSFRISKEKEELYIRGFLDGFHVVACLDELSSTLLADERLKSAEMNP